MLRVNTAGFTALLILAIATHATAQPKPAVFGQPTQFPAGVENPAGLSDAPPVVNGDFNHDGFNDIAVLGGSAVSVVLGGPQGFGLPVSYPVGTRSRQMAAADFNGDGNLDLLVLADEAAAALLLGNGDGSFQAPVTITLPTPMVSMTVGDFNHDGRPDVAFASQSAAKVYAALGNGNGTFGAFVPSSTAGDSEPIRPVWIGAGDFNNDGYGDLIVLSKYTYDGYKEGVVVNFAPGNGSGSFTFGAEILTAIGYPIAFADMNDDGNLDIVLIGTGGIEGCVYLGEGNGSFAAPITFPIENSPGNLTIADVNGDGIPDVVTANLSGSATVLIGHGDGTLGAPSSYAAGTQPLWVGVGGYFSSDIADLAVLNNIGAHTPYATFSLIRNKGNANFAAQPDFDIPNSGSAATVGDFTGDGKLDILAPVYSSSGNYDLIKIFPGLGSGEFGPAVATIHASAGGQLFPADFNGDGLLDFAFVGVDAELHVALHQPGITFQIVSAPLAEVSDKIAWAGDLNGDGIPDLLMDHTSGGEASSMYVLLGKGNGTFQAPLPVNSGTASPYEFVVADFNGDGKVDLVVAGPTVGEPNPAILFGNGDGTFQPPVSIGPQLISNLLVAGDFNQDGKLDLAVFGPPLTILLGNGDGTFRELAPTTFDNIPWQAVVADLNLDGHPDLLVNVGGGDNLLNIYLGNGDGTFEEQAGTLSCVIYNGTCQIFVSDLNGDHRPDILSVSYGIASALLNETK
jgi:hypothetical protein